VEKLKKKSELISEKEKLLDKLKQLDLEIINIENINE